MPKERIAFSETIHQGLASIPCGNQTWLKTPPFTNPIITSMYSGFPTIHSGFPWISVANISGSYLIQKSSRLRPPSTPHNPCSGRGGNDEPRAVAGKPDGIGSSTTSFFNALWHIEFGLDMRENIHHIDRKGIFNEVFTFRLAWFRTQKKIRTWHEKSKHYRIPRFHVTS